MDLQKSLKVLDEQRDQLEYQANHDSLTDLPNRILFIDLDHFKEINDSLGHHVGDKVLVEFSNRMKKIIRKSDTISRLGGDEFSIILNEVTDEDNITNFIVKSMEIIKEPFIISGRKLHVGMSIGISMYPNDGDSSNLLLQNADAAMYKAKESGRGTYSFYDEEMTHRALERISLETELRNALKEDELVVYFQPQIDASNDKLVGMEALVRWEHPTLGLIFPDKFIPLAELTGLIVDLDRVVMKKALSQFKKWYKAGFNPGKLAMNLAMKQIESADLVEFLDELIKSEECSYNNIELEVTENQIMKDPDKSVKVLEALNKLGISIAIDDFGTGYSSLAYLKRLPIRKIKIDKSFVDGLPHDAEDVAISNTVINLCRSLDLKVIAEGVETEKQKNFLLENGCKYIQGYLYSKPLSAEDMTKYLQKV
jgi:diguanylate cyclase (GGDEF)-like protein